MTTRAATAAPLGAPVCGLTRQAGQRGRIVAARLRMHDDLDEDTQRQRSAPDEAVRAPVQRAMAEYRGELEKLPPELKREVAVSHALEQLCTLEPEFAGDSGISGADRALLELAISALAGAIRPLPYERRELWEQAMRARRMLQRVLTREEKQFRAAFLLDFLANSPLLDWRFLGAQLLRHVELLTGGRPDCSIEIALGKANFALESWSPSSGARLLRPKRRWEALNDLLRIYGLHERHGEALRASVGHVARVR